ncbi:hypothetical protein LTR53_001251 [Teratosphaeriaceae sp. CCFEE 6253]|nr:hypothetical protein LTR53_001251 [Teratosphaeriaceae sp. CCFEE 6253]
MAPRINLPPITRALLLINIALSALNASIRLNKWRRELDSLTPGEIAAHAPNYLSNPQWAVSYLALVPTKSLRDPWTFVTAAWVENNLLSLAISAAVIWYGGRYLERAWGGKEFAYFVGCVTVLPYTFTFVIYAIWHAFTGTPDFPTPLQGLLPLEAAFLVALKQLVPEHTVSLFRATLRIRLKHLPALFTLANILSGPLLGTDTAFWLGLAGFMTGWVYLRFFRVTDTMAGEDAGAGTAIRGDASETFAFVAFFPDALHPFLTPVCDGVYDTLVALRVCTPFTDEAVLAGNARSEARSDGLPGIMERGQGGSAGGRRAEAERRRALALRALDQRLSAAAEATKASGASDRAEDAARVATGDVAAEAGSHVQPGANAHS